MYFCQFRKICLLALLSFVFCFQLVVWIGAARAEQIPPTLDVTAEFDHKEYIARWFGNLNLYVGSGSKTSIEFRVPRGLPRRDCDLTASWSDHDPETIDTVRQPFCLTAPNTTPEELDAWISSANGAADPSLAIPVFLNLNGVLTNPDPVKARVSVLVCNADAKKKRSPGSWQDYAALYIPAGALTVDPKAASFTILGASLTDVNSATWNGLLDCLNPEQSISRAANEGTAELVGGTLGDPDTSPTAELSNLARALDIAARLGLAPDKTVRDLARQIRGIEIVPRTADLPGTLADIHTVGNDVTKLLEPTLAQGLSGFVERAVGSYLDPALPPERVIGICKTPPVLPACEGEPIHVAAGANISEGDPDGTPAHPYPTIGGAITASPNLEECAPRILVASGFYREDLFAGKHVRIEGEPESTPWIFGRLAIGDPVFVSVQGVAFAGSPGPAAVYLNHPCARVELRNTQITLASRNGIRQHGGILGAADVSVQGTRRPSSASDSDGAGVFVSGGGRTVLNRVLLDANQGPGLLAEDMDTDVFVRRTEVRHNRMPNVTSCDSIPPGPLAAIEIREDATLDIEAHVSGNESMGIRALDGGQIHFRRGIVADTRRTRVDGGCLGIGVSAAAGGTIELSNFLVIENALAGMTVLPGDPALGGDGSLYASDGTLQGHPIGIYIGLGSYDYDRIVGDVRFVDNDRNIDAAILPLPDSGDP